MKTPKTMEKTYHPQDIEARWYPNWEEKGYFKPSYEGTPYCIMLPPPNVTGSLHMGHGFQHTLMDALIRYQRMCGHNVLWQAGTDHAGISTQMVVERQINALGKKRTDFSREEFTDKIWQWKETSGSRITSQLKRMGSSLDWSRERFTMDEGLSEAVNKVFIELYNEGLIYRGERLVNWDPHFKTAISDLEVIPTEEQGSLWHIRYPVVGSDESITIATTRPETLLGDTAICVHPDDERFKHLAGKEVQVPLCERTIPVIADDYVDMEFGTGCLKITPAHDFNDFEVGKRHQLPIINILNKDATLNENTPSAYQGLDRFDARKQIIKDLEAQELLVKIEPHQLKVPRGEKSGVVIEPFITKQWYVDVKPLAEPAIKAVKDGEIKFVPENWQNTYFQWMENIEDWCISRQLWWGHRIPAYYDEDNNIYVGYSEEDVRFKHKLDESVVLRQDDDVLDTWFSSALWPFSTLGWPNKTKELETFYTTNVLVTGFDIIFFWVARMIMMGLKFMNKVPFREVYITGLIRDHDGQKMSKSKGNVIDPLDIIDGIGIDELLEKRTQNLMLESAKNKIIKLTKKEFPEGIQGYGTDALRFTYCALATPGRNIRFDMNRVEGYRNFCNKLWNAARYVLMNVNSGSDDLGDGAFQYSPQDEWILSRLQQTIKEARVHFGNYRFDLLAQCLYEFIWHEYCDWYLELSKPVLYDNDAIAPQKRGTRRTLLVVLEQSLRLMHPLMPFITEEIWQKIKGLTSSEGDSIMTAKYPEIDANFINIDVEKDITWLKSVIQAIRTMRSEMLIAPSKSISVILRRGDDTDKHLMEKFDKTLTQLAKIETVEWVSEDMSLPASVTSLVGGLEINIPLAGLIDLDDACARLEKELATLTKEKTRAEGKLSNEKFTSRAPQDVIDKEKARLEEVTQAMDKLTIRLNELKS